MKALCPGRRAETQTVCYAALRLQGWSIARQEPIAASATYRFRDGRDWDLQLRRAKIIYRLIMGVLRPTRFPLPDHDDDDTSKHCKDCLVTRLHRPYVALPLWFSQNHVTEMDDLRETIFGSSAHKGGSSSSLHRLSKSRSSAVGVSYIREDHLPDWTQIKSHNNTKLCMVSENAYSVSQSAQSHIENGYGK